MDSYKEDNITETILHNNLTNPQLLHYIVFIVHGYVMYPILFLGMCGNVLSLVVFLRCRKGHDANVQYLSRLAVSDTCCIIVIGIQGLERGLQVLEDGWEVNIMMYSSATCKLYHYLMFVFSNISAWTLAAFSVERAFVVLFPFKRASLTPRKRRVILNVILFLSAALTIYKPILVDIKVFSGTPVCYYLGQTQALVLHMVDASINIYFPTLAMFIANAFIVYGLVHARKFQATATATAQKDNQDRKTSVNLITLSTLYISLMLPREVFWTYFEIIKYRNFANTYVLFILQLASFFDSISALNYSINFLIYGFSLPFYRQALRQIICCCCRSSSADGKKKSADHNESEK
jgi:hypothetical protein